MYCFIIVRFFFQQNGLAIQIIVHCTTMWPRANLRLVVAVSSDGVIGVNNKIPWHIPQELKLFKEITTNKKYLLDWVPNTAFLSSVIMGRKTFESIGKPLQNRLNIVISRSQPPRALDNNTILFVKTIDEAIFMNGRDRIGYVIGGSEIYRNFLYKNYCGYLFISQLNLSVLPEISNSDSVVYMPLINKNKYKLKSILESNENYTLKLFKHGRQ